MKPLVSSLLASFTSSVSSLVPPPITHKNCHLYVTKLESDQGQAMLRSSLLDTAMQHKYGGSAWYILVNSFDMSSGILQFLEVLWIKFTALIVVPPAL